MSDHTVLPWKWHPKFVVGDRNGSIYSEQRPGHAYAVAMQPRYVSDEQWALDASLILTAVNTQPAVADLVKALEAVLDSAQSISPEQTTALKLASSALSRFRELARANNGSATK